MELKRGTVIIVKRKNFKQVKEELKTTTSLDKIRSILENAIITSISDMSEHKFLSNRLFETNVEDNIFKNVSNSNKSSSSTEDLNSIDLDYENPLGVSDEETYTNEITLEFKKTRVKSSLIDEGVKKPKRTRKLLKAKDVDKSSDGNKSDNFEF